jgi:hypothetical protein
MKVIKALLVSLAVAVLGGFWWYVFWPKSSIDSDQTHSDQTHSDFAPDYDHNNDLEPDSPTDRILIDMDAKGQTIKGSYVLVADAQVLSANRGIQLTKPMTHSSGALTWNFNPGPNWVCTFLDRGQGDLLYVSFYHYLSEIGWNSYKFSGYRIEFHTSEKTILLLFQNQLLTSALDSDTDSPRINILFDHGHIIVMRNGNKSLEYHDTNFDSHASAKDSSTYFEIGAANLSGSDTHTVANILLKSN